MNASTVRRATTLGVAAALILLGLIVGAGFVSGSDPPEERTSALPIADLDDEVLPGATRMTLAKASEEFPVPLYRPNTSLASDATVSETWVRVNDAPEVWIQYRSGIVVLVRPVGDLLQTREYAEAQIAQGIPGRIVTVGGVEAFLVLQSENGSGSVRLVLDGVVVDVIGYIGDFSAEQLTEAAESVVETSDEVASTTGT